MQNLPHAKPFEFKKNKRSRYSQRSEKYYRKITLQKMKDKKRKRRILKLRRIHLNRYISVKYKGGKWWNKLMNIYYGEVTKEEIENCKQNTTSQIMLNFSQIKIRPRSYAQMFIFKSYPQLANDNILKFLFRGVVQAEDVYELIIYEYKLKPILQESDQCFIMNPKSVALPSPKKLATIRIQNIKEECQARSYYKANVQFKYLITIKDMDLIDRCLDYQKIYKHNGYNHIECELALLPTKLTQIHSENHRLWDKIIKNYNEQILLLQNLKKWESETTGLLTRLACKDRMLFFKKGFSNKTEDQLQEALQQLQLQQKRLIYSRRIKKCNRLASYNDCKICFYPEVKQTNFIVFCTTCYVSYHVNCYGLKKVQKTELYICDACLYMEKKDLEYDDFDARPICQICYSKQEFPLKQIQNLFYHVTCLYFYNIAVTQSFEVKIKQNSLELITQSVKSNKKPRCAYCLPTSIQNGLTLQCRHQACQFHFHPLCAYLRGCEFQILRLEELKIAVKCHQHTFFGQEDDQIRQVYLRRFFCNYKNIQKFNQEQFKPLYSNQILQIKIQLKKTQGNAVDWHEYDTIRKIKNQKRQAKKALIQKYKLMSIEELLQVAKFHSIQNQTQLNQNEQKIQEDNEQAELYFEDAQQNL